jgi:hypothetical protein
MEAEWLATHCVDYTRDNHEDESDSGRPKLKLREENDFWLRNQLKRIILTALGRANLRAESVMNLGAILWLIEKLPVHYEEYMGSFRVTKIVGENSVTWEFRFDEEGLTLQTSEIMKGEWGNDFYSVDVLKLTPTSWNEQLGADLDEWTDNFCKYAAQMDDRVPAEWYPEYQMPGEVD